MISFSAHKNGVAQGSIPHDQDTKITFTTEAWDDGGYYDAANSKWTPPAGKYRISCHLGVDGTNVIERGALHIWLYKNGGQHKAINIIRANELASVYASGSVLVEADGDDYFEIFMLCAGTGDLNINGIVRDHFWQGEEI